jgi:pantothenate kinase-related protein Tda10
MDPLLREGLALPLLAQVEGLVASGHRPLLALNGPVGAGKSRFCQQLIGLAQARGLRLAVASIDDAYLPWAQRLEAMAGKPLRGESGAAWKPRCTPAGGAAAAVAIGGSASAPPLR